MRRATFSVLFFLCLTSAARLTTAQDVQTNPKPTNCENHIAVLEAANHDAGKDGLIR
jgi:hypothetical protein